MKGLRIKRRVRDSHKGDYGHVFVVAGSLGMTGAAYLCCEAALLSGAGLITLGIPKSLNAIMAKRLTEQMTLPLAETKDKTLSYGAYRAITRFAARCDCMAIGPGLSSKKQTQRLVRSLIEHINLPMVIDADALNALSGHTDILLRRGRLNAATVITPHPGEMSRLINKRTYIVCRQRKKLAKEFAYKYNVTTIIKGHSSVVSAADGRGYVNPSGNPGMATGGCGDVLVGIIAAFLGHGMDSFKAARLGVYIHGLAGDMAAESKGEISLRATDLLRFLPEAFKKVYS